MTCQSTLKWVHKMECHLLNDITKKNLHPVSLPLYFIECERADCRVLIETHLLGYTSISSQIRISLTEKESVHFVF